MPFDPSIFQMVGHNVPQLDVAGSMAKGLQLRQLIQANDDDKAMRELSQQAGGNLNQLADLAQQKGLYKQAQDIRTKSLAQQKEIAQIQETMGKVDAQKRAAVEAGNADVAKMAAWADTPEKWAQGMKVILQDHPIMAQGLQPFQQFSPENRAAVMTKAQTVQQAIDGLKPKMEERNGQIVPVTTNVLGQQTVGAPVSTKAQETIAKINQDEHNGLISHEDAFNARKKANYIQPNIMQLTTAAAGGNINDQIEAYKKGLLAGQLPFPTGRDLTDPVRSAAYRQAITEDPTFNASTHKQRQVTFQKFTTGPEAQTLNKIGTALSHLSEYSDILEKVPDVGLTPLNSVLNKVRGAAGNVDIARANTTRTTLANELEGAYRAGGGTEAGIEHMRELLDPNLPLEARRANLATVTSLLKGKQDEMLAQYNRGMGKFGVPLDVLSPEAQIAQEKVLKRGGVSHQKPAPQAAAPTPQQPQAKPSSAASSLW